MRAAHRELACAAGLALFLASPASAERRGARAADDAARVVATQLRAQGYECKSPKGAERDEEDSRPDAAAWIVDCGDVVYRVRLIPHRAAEVEIVPPQQ